MMTRTLHLVTTKDDEKIAVWKVVDNSKEDTIANTLENSLPNITPQNIFLTHGTFSDVLAIVSLSELSTTFQTAIFSSSLVVTRCNVRVIIK